MARAWDVLMKRLGYTRYVSQGGDSLNIASHGKEQDFYFGADGLLRRHDYHVNASVASQPHSMF